MMPVRLSGMVAIAAIFAIPVAAQTQADMNAQAAASLRRADAAMNAQWKVTYARMKKEEVSGDGFAYAAALLNAQRAWLAFRDAHCKIASAEVQGGSMWPMLRAACMTKATTERTRQLKELMWQR